jgi:hypothetical protein
MQVRTAGAVVQRSHQQWHWLFECGSRGLNVGNMTTLQQTVLNPLNAELNPLCHLLALLAHPILHISRIKVKIAILLRFGIENLQKCVCLVSPCHPVRIEQREAN